jgi:DNA-binding NtrC family response regulator
MNLGQGCQQNWVLAVDDECGMLELVKSELEREGFAVQTASLPTEALSLYEEHWREIKVVVSDFKMPGMNGEALFDHLQRINPEVRAILMTGFYGDRVAAPLFAKGLRRCIEKPFHLEELVDGVRDAMVAD